MGEIKKKLRRTLHPRPDWYLNEDEIKNSDLHDEKSLQMM
jgi:hypothetical protein